MPNQKPITTVSDPRWLRAISHPIRIRLLAMLEEEAASPVILAARLEQPLGTVAYHVRTLYDLGLLKLVSTRQRRGATEHFYRAVNQPPVSDEAWGDLDAVSKQRLLTAMLTRAHEYASRSAAAGGFDRAEARFETTSLELDEEGWARLAEASRQFLASAQTIAAESNERAGDGSNSKFDVGLTLQLFEGRPFSAETPD